MRLQAGRQEAFVALVRHEQRVLAAKIRISRAVLGWSQTDLAQRIGMTQRAVHKLEQGETEPRRATVLAIEAIWQAESIGFEDLPDGSFRLLVPPSAIDGESVASTGSNVVRHRLSGTCGRYRV
ncbi:MAG TPA: helix-turn-helix transcriptional regulator [Pseudolabrys sp.]|nr:helix-turn-helix transcriptional regulator [Pseudolabrys sp.]